MSEYISQDNIDSEAITEDLSLVGLAETTNQTQAAVDMAVTRGTAPLREYLEQASVPSTIRRDIGQRILNIEDIVRDNPERALADVGKPPGQQTEHDPERAHLIAAAIDGNMTSRSRGYHSWQGGKQDRDRLGIETGTRLASEVYSANPNATPVTVELRRRWLADRGDKGAQNVKGIKID